MKALDKSADSPTKKGRVDWFAFLSSVNGGLRINADLPLGIGADSELCFSFEDAKHAVTFSREGNRLFVTPQIGGVSIDGEQIQGRVQVAPNTTLMLGQTPMFIATSPVLDRMPSILVRERSHSQKAENTKAERSATNVVQLPTRRRASDGVSEIVVPEGIPASVEPDLQSTDWAVATKTPQTLKLRVWRMALLLCLSGAVLFPWLKRYIPDIPDTLDTTNVSEAVARPAGAPAGLQPAVESEAKSAVEPELTTEVDTRKNRLQIIVPDKSGTQALPVKPPPLVALPAPVTPSSPVATPAPVTPSSPVATPAPEKPSSLVATPAPVTPSSPVATTSPVTLPDPIPVPENTQAAVSSRTQIEQQKAELPRPADAIGTPQNTAYSAIEQVDTEHLLVAAQWAMRNGDGPGALILLEAIITKVPDHAQALVLRDQLSRIMTEVELE